MDGRVRRSDVPAMNFRFRNKSHANAWQTGQSSARSGPLHPRHLGSRAGMKTANNLNVSAETAGLSALVGALAVAAAGSVILAFVQLGPLSGHMVAWSASLN